MTPCTHISKCKAFEHHTQTQIHAPGTAVASTGEYLPRYSSSTDMAGWRPLPLTWLQLRYPMCNPFCQLLLLLLRLLLNKHCKIKKKTPGHLTTICARIATAASLFIGVLFSCAQRLQISRTYTGSVGVGSTTALLPAPALSEICARPSDARPVIVASRFTGETSC